MIVVFWPAPGLYPEKRVELRLATAGWKWWWVHGVVPRGSSEGERACWSEYIVPGRIVLCWVCYGLKTAFILRKVELRVKLLGAMGVGAW